MQLSPSAHADTFCRDNLPPPEQWPEFTFSLPALRYPDRLNCAEELLDTTIKRHGADRPCVLSPSGDWTYGELLAVAGQVARVLTEDFGVVPGNRVLLRGAEQPVAGGLLAGRGQGRRGHRLDHAAAAGGRARDHRRDRRSRCLALCDHRFTGDLAAGLPGLRCCRTAATSLTT